MAIPDQMKACQVVEPNNLYTLRTIPVPKPQPKELLLRIGAASLCHTDFMVAAGVFETPLPVTGSHEGAGTVVGMGYEVTSWKEGERVMAPIVSGRCGTCNDCKGEEGYRHYCTHEGHRGVTKDGAFAEYMLVDAEESVRIPDGVPLEVAAPLACAGRTVYRAITLPRLSRGQTICLVGSGGGLGHIGIQFAKLLSLRVICIEARDSSLHLSRDLGADLVLDARKGKDAVVKAVQEFTGETLGADATVNLSDAETAAELACAVTKMHGTMVQVAQPERVSFPFQEMVFRDVRVVGSLLCSKKEAEEMLGLVAKGGVEVRRKVVKGLERVGELVEGSKKGEIQGKGVVLLE